LKKLNQEFTQSHIGDNPAKEPGGGDNDQYRCRVNHRLAKNPW
jgi:hypothetical protein